MSLARTQVSLARVARQERPRLLEHAHGAVLRALEKRLPPAEGYRYQLADGVARWARPGGDDLLGLTPAEPDRAVRGSSAESLAAFRRDIDIQRGVTFGLTVCIESADPEAAVLDITLRVGVRLRPFVFLGATALAVALAVLVWSVLAAPSAPDPFWAELARSHFARRLLPSEDPEAARAWTYALVGLILGVAGGFAALPAVERVVRPTPAERARLLDVLSKRVEACVEKKGGRRRP